MGSAFDVNAIFARKANAIITKSSLLSECTTPKKIPGK